jgi:hypothetical protein
VHVAILAFRGFNALDALIALGLLNRIKRPSSARRLVALLLCALAGCGGTDGSEAPTAVATPAPSPAPAPSTGITVSPARLDLVVAAGVSAPFALALTPDAPVAGATLTVWPTDASGFLQSTSTQLLRADAQGRFVVTLGTPADAPAGRRTGTLVLVLCTEPSCTRLQQARFVGVPYAIEVTATPGP